MACSSFVFDVYVCVSDMCFAFHLEIMYGLGPVALFDSCRAETLQGNPKAIEGVAESFKRIQLSAEGALGLKLSDAAYKSSSLIREIIRQATDTTLTTASVENMPAVITMNIETTADLDSSSHRLNSL